MKKYKVEAVENLETTNNTWTRGLEYEVTETETKFQLTSNEGQVAYLINLKQPIMEKFKII